LDAVAADLSDPRGETWPRRQLKFWLTEAVGLIVRYVPTFFSETVVVALTGGETGYRPVCPCLALTPEGVLGQSTALGDVVRPLRPRADDASVRWFPAGKCPAVWTRPFSLSEYSISPDGDGIRVWPEPPPGEVVYLALRCPVMPDVEDDDAEVDDDALATAAQWILYRAKNMDAENNPAIFQAAYDNKENFFLLLGQPLARGRSSSSKKKKTTSEAS
jgi:hypothetical protein